MREGHHLKVISMARSDVADQFFIGKLTDIILANLRNKNFGVGELSHLMGQSQSALNHRLHSINQKNINQFIREVRLRKALEILRSEDLTAAEVAYRVGFSSPAYFNSCFHEFFGYSPGHIKSADSSSFVENITDPEIINQNTRENKRYNLILKISGILLLAGLILIIAILGYPFLIRDYFKDNPNLNYGRLSVVVMPFKNMTGDANLNIWEVGIQDNIITYLSKDPKDLKVLQTESIRILFQKEGLSDYKIRRSDTISLLRKLHANVAIMGTIGISDSNLRINTRLINPETRKIFKSFQNAGNRNNILEIVDSISYRMN